MQNVFCFSCLICSLILINGCATITRGSDETFIIQSMPSGASAQLSNGFFCTTPCTLVIPRKGSFTVTLEKDGYEPVITSVISSRDGNGTAGMAGNLVFGGLIGMGVDATSGAMNSHKPNPLVVNLMKISEEEK